MQKIFNLAMLRFLDLSISIFFLLYYAYINNNYDNSLRITRHSIMPQKE